MRVSHAFLCLLLAACKGGGDTEPSGDTDDTDGPPCSALESGTYAARGSCFGMTMSVDLAFDEAECSFTLSGWSMNHDDPAEGGTVSGDGVTLTGPDPWGTCAGTIEGGIVSGVCDDGCAWELEYSR